MANAAELPDRQAAKSDQSPVSGLWACSELIKGGLSDLALAISLGGP